MIEGSRYCFDLGCAHVWRDLWHPWFWRMWGIRRTLRYLFEDTIRYRRGARKAAPPMEDIIEIDENGVVHAKGPQAARDLRALSKLKRTDGEK